MNVEQEKIARYESFLNDRLKVDLAETLQARDKLHEQISDCLKLSTHIETIKENNLKELETLVDLGSNVYAHAKIKDTRHIFVDVGFGFHVELTLDEALKFIVQKEERLKSRALKFTQEAAKIRAHIVMVLEALAEIMRLQAPT